MERMHNRATSPCTDTKKPMHCFFLVLLSCFLGTITHIYADDAVPVAGCSRLVLLLDKRLTSAVVQQEWASGNERDERPARLELRGCQGELLDSLQLEAALAQLHPAPLRGTEVPTYLVSVDLTAESGSYNGPLTMPIEVRKNRLQQATASNADKQSEPIQLALTGKAAWKKITRGKANHFLAISCQPRDDGFILNYRRYFPTRQGWQVRKRTQPSFWESDQDFPADNLFP